MSSAEEIVTSALSGLGVRAYADQAPDAVADDLTASYAVFQSVGGQDVTNLDNDPDELQNSRVQVAVWSPARGQSVTIMQAVRRLLMAVGAKPIGGAVSVYEEDTKRYGSRLDFSIWFRESGEE